MKNTFLIWLVLASVMLALSFPLRGQEVVLKTNLAYWATATPNIGVETAIGKKWSLGVSGGAQWWQYSDVRKLKHWLVQPELHYWFCETFNGHFLGAHLLGGQFNVGGVNFPFGMFSSLKESRYQGWAAGGGVAYGYHLLLNRRWSMEFSVGVGYLYMDYKKYRCSNCGQAQKQDTKHYLGPTKLAVSLIYNL